MTQWREIKFLPEGLIALNKELSTGFHPALESLLERHPATEWEVRFAHIAAYCEIILDDIYHQEDFDRLGHILVERLVKKRTLPNAQVILH